MVVGLALLAFIILPMIFRAPRGTRRGGYTRPYRGRYTARRAAVRAIRRRL